MHEQSETVQTREGQWVNVYGKGTARGLPGKPLEPKYFYESATYPTMEAAVAAAERRSQEPETGGSEPHTVDRQAAEPAGPAQGGSVDVDEFLRDIKSLSPQEQAEMKAEFLRRYIMPNKAFQGASVQGKYAVMRALGVPEDTAFPGQGAVKGPDTFLERVKGRAGIGQPAAPGDWMGAGGNVLKAMGLLPAAVGETVDTAMDPYYTSRWRGRPMDRPTAGQLAEYSTMIPRVYSALVKSPMLLNRFLNAMNQRITMPSPPGPMTTPRQPLMLPPAGGSTQNPFVMGGGFQKPVPPPYSRPASTMPTWSKKSLPDELVPPGPID